MIETVFVLHNNCYIAACCKPFTLLVTYDLIVGNGGELGGILHELNTGFIEIT